MPIILNGTTGITTPGITNTGTFTFQGVVELPAGTVSAPSLTTTGDTNTGIYFPAANQVAITTDGTQRILVDATGNIGVGITPSAWSTGGNIQLSNLSSKVDGVSFANNAYFNSGWKYASNGFANLYSQVSGQHIFYNAASGTAGNSISLTQAMTLDASGYLLLGTTTSTNAVATFGNNNSGSGYGYQKYSAFFGTNIGGAINPTNNWGVSIGWNRSSGGGESNIVYGTGAGSTPGLAFASWDGSTYTERARLTSAGQLLVGLTSSYNASSVLQIGGVSNTRLGIDSPDAQGIYFTLSGVNNGTYRVDSSGNFEWYTKSVSQAMVLSAAGNLGVGTSSPTSKLHVVGAIRSSNSGNENLFLLDASNQSSIQQNSANLYFNVNDASASHGGVIFRSSNALTTRMVLDASGNLGVGTSSVFDSNTRLELSKSGNCQQFISSTDSSGVRIYLSANGTTSGNIGTFSNHALTLRTNDTERARITSDGSFQITQTPGKYTVDTSSGAQNIASGGTVDFSSSSGMLIVNDWSNGWVTIYLCGGGNTVVVSSVGGQVGTLAYDAGINGYRWTNNTGSTRPFGFFFVRTRSNA